MDLAPDPPLGIAMLASVPIAFALSPANRRRERRFEEPTPGSDIPDLTKCESSKKDGLTADQRPENLRKNGSQRLTSL